MVILIILFTASVWYSAFVFGRLYEQRKHDRMYPSCRAARRMNEHYQQEYTYQRPSKGSR